MNLPNKLTVLRVLLIPFFVASLLYKAGEDYNFRIIALIIFIIAALTDTLWRIRFWFVRGLSAL